MTHLTSTLSHLGLTDKQIAVYLATLELGESTVQEIAEKSGVKRTSIYNFLDEMKQRGLMIEVRRNKHVFLIAEDPRVLVKHAHEQAAELESLLPDLLSIYNLPGNKPKVRFYQGIAGIKQVYEDTLKEEYITMYGFSDYEKMFAAMPETWMWEYAAKRARQHILFKSIAKQGPHAKQVKTIDKEQRRETKLVPHIDFDTEINIYHNKVALISFHRPYAAVIIEDRAIATTLKSVWKLVWGKK